jgi:hypothetical protein
MRQLFSALLVVLSVSNVLTAQTAGGLRWSAPKGWRTEAAQSMRAATYTAAPVPGDAARAECAVYFFGAGQGGSVAANLERWQAQFNAPNGQAAKATIAKRSARGLTITTIDTSGVYSGLTGPMGGGAPVKDYRLLGAIIEGAGGNVFVKFTGPLRTIGANQLQFEELLASFQPVK